MTTNQSENLSLKETKREDLKKNLPHDSEGIELVVDRDEDKKQPIDYSPYVRVGNLLVFEEMTAVEVIIPIPVAYLGMLESASAREWWGKDQFGDSPIWKNGLSWLYDEFIDRLEVISEFFIPCNFWNIKLEKQNRENAQLIISKQIRNDVDKLLKLLQGTRPYICKMPEYSLKRFTR